METWTLSFDEWDEKEESLRESLCALGNGYFATRGASEENAADEHHYPGTYLAGGHNRLKTVIKGIEVENEDLVNWPNWLCLTFRSGDGDWFDLKKVHIVAFDQVLDIQYGELRRSFHVRDNTGKETLLESRRFVSMDNKHTAGLQWIMRPLNWSGPLELKSHIDASVTNWGVKRYRDLNSKHLKVRNKHPLDKGSLLLEVSTTNSEIVMAQASRTSVYLNEKKVEEVPVYWEDEERAGHVLRIDVSEGDFIRIEKVVCLFTSKDKAITQPAYEAERLLKTRRSYDILFRHHGKQWERLWSLCDINLSENPRETKLLRLHIFHLLQTVSFKTIDLDAGVPSRGLHGEAYRGHIFWDELFILPFLNLRVPEISRSLLMYRYRRRHEARLNAKSEGYIGAMFPWQSGSNGEEESQVFHLNPHSGHWVPDNTYKQRHINATIVFNIWKYYQVTGDLEFMFFFGSELMLEISKFWSSTMTFNEVRGRYDIKGVVGPDEFHTKYPDREELGIDNNAYTNYMASWCMRTTLKVLSSLPKERLEELFNVHGITRGDLARWEEMSKKLYIPFIDAELISQFEGFEKLKDLDWNHYRKKYGNIQRLDRILEAEGDNANCYKINKQADVLMLFYLFTPEELEEGFRWLNYPFERKSIPKNIEYHVNLSTNGSSLSRIVHSWVLSRYDYSAWMWFQQALESDVADIQGGTTAEGIHLGAMAGTVDLVQRCFTGLEAIDDVLMVRPSIPEEIKRLEFSIRFRGQSLLLRYEKPVFFIKLQRTSMPSVKINVGGVIHCLRQGEGFSFEVHSRENNHPRLDFY